MKPVWQGSISFGLVSIPIKLYSAVQAHPLGFTLLHSTCKTPLEYERWCPTCKKKVEWHAVVKGIKLGAHESYTVITSQELHTLRPEKTDEIDIVACIDAASIDPIYFNSHYYVQPAKQHEKAFFLFSKILASKKYMAIGRFVMREKEHLIALQTAASGLLLSTLHYHYEIRPLIKLEKTKAPALTKQELALAQELVDKLYTKKLDLATFKDTYIQKLTKALARKQAGKKQKQIARPRKTKTPPQQTLITTLKASLQAPRTSTVSAIHRPPAHRISQTPAHARGRA